MELGHFSAVSGVCPSGSFIPHECYRVFIEDQEAIGTVAALLERDTAEAKCRARGPVQMCLMAPDLPGEEEIALGG